MNQVNTLPSRTFFAQLLIGLLILGGIGFGAWLLFEDSGRAIVHDSNSATPVAHIFSWEKDKVAYPGVGSPAVPEEAMIAQTIDGHRWQIALDMETESISPVIGAKVKGTIKVLRDGQPVSELPEQLMPGVHLEVEGISGWRCISPLVNVPSFTDIGQDCGSLYQLPIYDQPLYGAFRNTGVSSFITSKAAYHETIEDAGRLSHFFRVTHLEPWGDNYLRITEPITEFELVYMGGRYLPYLNISAYAGESKENPGLVSNKVIFFSDQLTADWDIDVAEIVRGDFYYEAEAEVVQRVVGGSTIRGESDRAFDVVKIDITARNSRSNEIDDSDRQRVRVWAFPLMVDDGYSRPEEFGGQFTTPEYASDSFDIRPGGHFPEMIWDNFGSSGGGFGSAVEHDLEEGRATVYYAIAKNNLGRAYSQNLVFMIQPVSFDYAQCAYTTGGFSCSYNRPYEEMPPLPTEGGGRGEWFLYKEWQDPSLINQVYTLFTFPLSRLES